MSVKGLVQVKEPSGWMLIDARTGEVIESRSAAGWGGVRVVDRNEAARILMRRVRRKRPRAEA